MMMIKEKIVLFTFLLFIAVWQLHIGIKIESHNFMFRDRHVHKVHNILNNVRIKSLEMFKLLGVISGSDVHLQILMFLLQKEHH